MSKREGSGHDAAGADAGSSLNDLWQEIEARMGVCPSFFRLAHADPQIARGLFDLAKFAYLDIPLPPLFKEKLFTYLSRFCPVRYCVSRHAAFLIGRGYVAGDAGTPALPVDEVAALLSEPLTAHDDLPGLLVDLEQEPAPLKRWPDLDTPLGKLFRVACALIITEADRAPQWSAALRRLLGAARYEQLMLFLAFVRTAHFWSEVHPELQPEQDVERLLHEHEALAAPILHRDGDAERAFLGGRLHAELTELRDASAFAAALRENERRLNLALNAGRMGAWEWDITSNVVTWSSALENIHGLKPGTFSGAFEDFQRDMHPNDRTRVLDNIQKSVRECTPYHTKYRIIRPDEEVRWLEARGEVICGDDGKAIRLVGVCADVTERHQTEEEAERHRKWIERVADATPDIIFVYDIVNNRNVYTNQTLADILGYDTEEFSKIENILEQIFPADELSAARSFYAGMRDAEEGEVRTFTHRTLHKDGSVVWLEDRVTPFQWDDGGRVRQVLGVAADITNRRQAEEAVHASEERYRAIVEGQVEMICRFRPDGTILFVNDPYARALGTTPEQLLAQNFWDFIDEADRPGVRNLLGRLCPDAPDVRIENRFQTTEGTRWTLWTNRGLAFDENGRATEVQSSGIDITERKQAELGRQQFFSLAESSGEFVGMCDMEMRPFYVNPAGLRLVGLDSLEDAMRVSVLDFFYPEDRGHFTEEFFDEVLREGRGELEVRFRHFKTGEPIWVIYSVVLLKDDSGNPTGFGTVSRDITGRKRAQEAVQVRALQQHTIAALGEVALRESDLQVVFDEATTLVAETLDVEYCKVLELLPGGDEVLLRSGVGWSDGLVGHAIVDTGMDSQAGYTLASQSAVVVDDLVSENRFSGPKLLVDHGVVSGMSCIIRGPGGAKWGVLGTHSTRRIRFTQDDVNFLVAVANVLGAAIQRKEAEEALREREEGYRQLSGQLKLLLDTTSQLIETLETQELISNLLNLSRNVVTADAFAVWRVDPAGNWGVVSQAGLSEEFLHDSIPGRKVDLPNAPIIVQPADMAKRSNPVLRGRWERYERHGIKSLMIIPLRLHGVVSATLAFYCRRPHVFTDNEVESAQALANIAAAAITSSELYESQAQLRRHAEDAAMRESFLATAGAILSESLDAKATLANVVRAAVPKFADWCAVDLLDENGHLRRVAVANVDPDKVKLAEAVYEKFPPGEHLDPGGTRVIETGKPLLVSEISATLLEQIARDDGFLQILRQMKFKSYLAVPLKSGGTLRGALVFVHAESDRRFGESDLAVAEEIGRRASQAIEHAELYRNLRESQERLQLLTDAMPALVGRLDHDLVYTFVNRAYADWFVLPREKIVGRHIRDVVGDATFKIIAPRLERARAGEHVQYEDTLPYARGGPRYVLATYIPEFGEDGAVRGVYVMVHDITARRETEERLVESEREFRAMFELAAAGKAQTEPETNRYTRVNRKLCEITGYSEEELLSFTPSDITHPDDRAEDAERSERVRRGDEQVWVSEKRYIRKDGEIVWVLVTGSAIRDDDGKVLRTIATIQNITDRKRAEEALRESEEKFRALADNIAQFAWMTDETGWIFWYNKRWFDYTGTTLEQMQGWGWKAVHHPDHVDRVVEKFSRCIKAGEVWEDTFPLRGKDGRYRWFLSRAIPIRDESGTVVRWFGTNTDITERKAAEEALQDARDELEERVRERTAQLRLRNEQLARLASELTLTERRERRRVADILHDHLQQLLVGAKLGLDILARGADDHQRDAVAHVKELIDEGIKASRTLTVELSPPILHDAGLAAGLDWLARWMNEKHGLEVRLEVDERAQTEREDVRVLLFESVRELLFNVVKHAQSATATVELSCYDERGLCVTVSDDGPGFDVEAVFASSTQTNSGFGLFSIRERFSLLGGRVDIDSRPGAGARFTLIAPIRDGANVPAMEEAVPESRLVSSPDGAKGPKVQHSLSRRIRVLVVDDHTVMRQGLTMLLAGERDIEIVGEAADGVEAVENALALRPDVVLMDFSMPRMDGVEATRHITEALPHVHVIGLSMYEEPDRAAAMMKAGAVAYRSKSGDSEEILRAIRNVHLSPH